MYQLIRTLLFRVSAERAHYFSMNLLKAFCSIRWFRKIVAKASYPGIDETVLWGIRFRNKIGLGAGFDKNARYLRELDALGFGFIEIGTVTPRPQEGNPKPRLFRLPKDNALINRMGFNNDGVEAVAERLKKWSQDKTRWDKKNGNQFPMVIGGNIGKNKQTSNEEAWKDYEICFRALHPFVDFFVVNVSSPNTPGLRELQGKDALRKIFTHLQELNGNFKDQKPILLKIAPDLTWTQIDDVLNLAKEIRLDGIVANNTTIDRTHLITDANIVDRLGAGGLSGLPLKKRSSEIVKYIVHKTEGSIPVIASGGVFTSEDAKDKFSAGAGLVEVWTGFIYKGPFIVQSIYNNLH